MGSFIFNHIPEQTLWVCSIFYQTRKNILFCLLYKFAKILPYWLKFYETRSGSQTYLMTTTWLWFSLDSWINMIASWLLLGGNQFTFIPSYALYNWYSSSNLHIQIYHWCYMLYCVLVCHNIHQHKTSLVACSETSWAINMFLMFRNCSHLNFLLAFQNVFWSACIYVVLT